jgi:ABC-2 type transport system permease protein
MSTSTTHGAEAPVTGGRSGVASPVSVLLRACRADWARIWSVRSSWVLAAGIALAVVGMGTIFGFNLRANPPSATDVRSGWEAGLFTTFFALFGVIAMAVVTATADHGTGGIVPTLQWTPRRGSLFAARTVVVAATTTLLAVALVTIASAEVAALVPQVGLPLDGGLRTLGTVAFVCLTGSLLGIGLGLTTRSTAAALVTALALMLVLPLVMGNLPFDWATAIASRLPGAGAIKLIFGDGPDDSMTPATARLTLTVWAVVAVAAGGWRLLRTDANQ